LPEHRAADGDRSGGVAALDRVVANADAQKHCGDIGDRQPDDAGEQE